jgi:Insertion element 4 transposase N-terminal/Transposase DDE domain
MITLDKEVLALSRAERLAGLKRIVPRNRIKRILRDCRKDRCVCPRLPSVFMVWFVLALGLFCRDCYRQVFRWIHRRSTAGVPGRSTLCEARHRLGVRPLIMLAQQTVELLADPQTPGAFYRHWRLMALDGFVVELPDSQVNARVFGRSNGGRAPSAFPQARVVALCEAGTHVMYRWLIKPWATAEQHMADYLLRFLSPDMLLIWDRNFLSYRRVQEVCHRGAPLLARVQNTLILRPIHRLADGSFLTKLYPNATDRKHDRNGLQVRIMEYSLDDPRRPGHGQKHRLLTTLMNQRLDPALKLIELYHMRWEEELSIDEIKVHEMERPTLRSQTPAGVIQELYALLLDHFIVRTLMFEAARRQGIAPLRLSFTGTLKILRCRINECPEDAWGQWRWWQALVEEVAGEHIEPRRNRINPRVIKRKMSKWKKKRPEHRPYPQPTKTFRDSVVMIR